MAEAVWNNIRSVEWFRFFRNMGTIVAKKAVVMKMNIGKNIEPLGPMRDLWRRHSSLSIRVKRCLSESEGKLYPLPN